jgi:hypothetical protein
MKKLHFILPLLFISTNCLFSQNNIIEENIDLSDSFYKGYLDDSYFVYPIINDITETNSDTFGNYNKTGIVSIKLGAGNPSLALASIGIDIPIYCNINFSLKYVNGGEISFDYGATSSFAGFGLGYVGIRTNNFILKVNAYYCIGTVHYEYRGKPGLNLGADILFKVYKPCYISISPDWFHTSGGNGYTISLGLNWVY